MASWGTGWLILAPGEATETKIRVEKWEYDDDDTGAVTIAYLSRGLYGYTMNIHKRKFKFTKLFVTNYADWNTLKSRLKILEDTGTVINIKIQVHSNGTDFEEPDGDGNDIIPVIIKKRRGHSKPYGGDAQFYIMKQLLCEQSGDLTA